MRDRETPRAEVVSTDAPGFDEMFQRHIAPTGGGLTLEQVEKQLRMANVFRHLSDDDIIVLLRRHVEAMTFDEMAEELKVSRQAVLKRVQVAEQNLRREFGNHWLDPIDSDNLAA